MKIEALLLDAGGILLDETEYEQKSAESISLAIQASGIKYQISDYWRDYETGIREFCPQSRQFVVWKACSRDLGKFNTIWHKFEEIWQQPPLKLMPGISEQIQTLAAEFRLVLAGQYGKDVYSLLEENQLNFFTNRLSQDDFSLTKPDPRYLEQIARAAQVNPAASIMIGDRIDKDVIPANQLGMKSIFVKSSVYRIQQPRIPAELPSRTVESIPEIYSVVKEIERNCVLRKF